MKAIALAAMVLGLTVLGLCGLARAEDGKANPVGTWQCEYEIGGKRTCTLTIKQEGDELIGTMSWPDQKNEPIKDAMFEEGKLTFSAVRKFMGNSIPVEYTLTINGDKFKGQGASEFGGQKQEFEIQGQREK